MKQMKIIKRSGEEKAFDITKIENAIRKASQAVDYKNALSEGRIKLIAEEVAGVCAARDRAMTVEEIQDVVETKIMEMGAHEVAKKYITYRYKQNLLRQANTTDQQIMSLIESNNEDVKQENSNKNPTINSVQRDYMAGEVSKDVAARLLLPADVVQAHNEGIIHFHDMDYYAQHMHNCDLVNLEDMLQNGTVISGTMIEKPKSFSTACNIATQIIAQVASNQYGGQSISLTHLAPFVEVSRQAIRKELENECADAGVQMSADAFDKIVEKRVRKEIKKGVQTIQYQVVTLMTTNGQAPFVTVFMYLNEAKNEQEKKDEQEPQQNNNQLAPEEQIADIDKSFSLPKMLLDLGKDRNIRRGSGKRSRTRTDLKQGRYVRAELPKAKVEDLAFDATIRAAAPFQKLREDNGCALNIKQEDLRQKVREKRIGNTFLFAVDASGSMGARERMRAVKGAIFYMLKEAYQKRDRVGMIAFRRQKAELLLPITRSVDLAQKCLAELPTGGKTPLADGLAVALQTLSMLNKHDSELEPILVLVTDGRANATEADGGDPVASALKMAERIGKAKITSVVIDTESDFIKLGLAKRVAAAMGANYYTLQRLTKDSIIRIVRNLDV